MIIEAGGTTRAIVQELLRRIAAGDPGRIAELYAPEVDWKVNWPEAEHGRAATPWIVHRRTRDDIAAHYRQLAAHHDPEQVATVIERILVDGPDAVVLGEIRQTALATDRPYRARFALHLTVDNGLVTRQHIYEDSLAVARAFDDPPRPPGNT
ncbi:nuclear transport factor 2 family protein [Nocardia sp. BMG51109]|uniref:nuclear transport factor 2 family protein n=1 Tax=Nocardia sp. BMG51109 TaxID=1056816 RepID=UPI00046458AF|nr:nuclear transport factor 2 family protein [Nocardia sp. BMG51109]